MTDKPDRLTLRHLTAHAISEWLNSHPDAWKELPDIIKTVSIGDWCDGCRGMIKVGGDPTRFPQDYTLETPTWVRAFYECHVCHHTWFCGHTEEYLNWTITWQTDDTPRNDT